MQGYLQRQGLLNSLRELLANFPAVALLGARQVGKSTLAKQVINSFRDAVYLDLQLPGDLSKISDPEAFFRFHQEHLVCLDEVQYRPELFAILRGMIDQKRENGRFLILGSASRDLIRQSSETLAGRIAFLEMAPFGREETGEGEFHRHWMRGGYPPSFLASSDRLSLKWRLNYIRTFLERDIPQLGFNIPAKTLEQLWSMLAHSQGQILNSSRLGANLGKSAHSIKNYINLLQQTFIVRVLQPYGKNVKKRVVKSPKVYIRDTGLLHALLNIEDHNQLFGHPVYGSSFESYVVENLCHHLHDYDSFFYRTSSGAELDLVLEKAGKKIAVEIKVSSAPKPSRGFWNAVEDVAADEKFLIAPVDGPYPAQNDLTITNLGSFLKQFD